MNRLEAVKKRLAEATPGPWQNTLGSGNHMATWVVSWPTTQAHPIFVADCLPDIALKSAEKDHRPNMALITNAPTDLKALVRVAEAAKNVVELYKNQGGPMATLADELKRLEE